MGKKATKATKKFASSGQLKKVIQARHKHRQILKRSQGRRGAKEGKERAEPNDIEEDGEEKPIKSKLKAMTVDDLLDGHFSAGSENEDEDVLDQSMSDQESDDDEADFADDASFASVDDLEEEGETHLLELSKLAEKDPEFYKYLQENDKELLNFDPHVTESQSDEDEGDIEQDVGMMPVLTQRILRTWQKALMEQRSLRALRKLLIAFRAAAHMNEDDQVLAWRIDSASVYNKLVTTTFRYTPVVLQHHAPYRTLGNGKFKPPAQTQKFKTLQKLILSYFHNILHILSQLTDSDMLQLALTESAKLLPYVVTSRKAVKLYLKKCLELWSSAQDGMRIIAFLSIRKLATASDASIMDHILKGTYLTLIRSSRSTSAHTLPSINLMKNSASEVFCMDHTVAYHHAFGYIRQLAIHLRNSMKVKTKEAYKLVYNWQYVHCVDFWAIVLARACDSRMQVANGGQESNLKPLIYPLVQVSLGAMQLISTNRSYPFHMHIIRSLLHLTKHSETYVPIASYLVSILSSTLTPSSRPKPSTLRPLDLEVQIRAPQQYVKTRVYSEGILEETVYLLGEWLSSPAVQGSIAFPEIIVPIITVLRKSLKTSRSGSGAGTGSGKNYDLVKVLLERVEENGRWVEAKRKDVSFAPGKLGDVQRWETDLKSTMEDSPLSKYLKVLRKTREKRRKLVEKAREGEDEILKE